MTNDQIINTSALALDTASVLAEISSKFIEGKIYKQKLKIVGGVEKVFFAHFSIKEALCTDILKFNSAYGDVLTSLKLQYLSDSLFFIKCRNDETKVCHDSGAKFPIIDYLISNTNRMNSMIDETFQAMKSNEDLICTKSVDFVGEVEYIRKRANMSVSDKSNFSTEDATNMMTSSTWSAVGTLMVAIQTGESAESKPDAKVIQNAIDKTVATIKDVGTKILKADAFKIISDKLKLDKAKEWAVKEFGKTFKYLPFAFEALTDKISLVQLFVDEMKNVDAQAAAETKAKPAASTTTNSNFTFKDGDLLINNECIKTPLGGCNLADWVKTLKETYEIVKFVINKETWKKLDPPKLLEVAANLVYLGIFGVKIYFFINDLITNQGNAQNINKNMTTLSNQFWMKTLDYVRKFLLAQKKVMELKNDFLDKVIKGENTEENQEKQKEARKKRVEVIKSFVSDLSSFILTPLIKQGLNYLLTTVGTKIVKDYLSTTLVSIKLVASFYKFSQTMFSLFSSIPSLIEFNSPNVDKETEIQKNYIEHINLHSNYVKCKYLLYIWDMFNQHSISSNQNMLKVQLKKEFFQAMRFKEKITKFSSKENDCANLMKIEDVNQLKEEKLQSRIIVCKTQFILGEKEGATLTPAQAQTEAIEKLQNEIKSICHFNIGFCKEILTTEYMSKLFSPRLDIIEDIKKEISYHFNYGPITFAIKINKFYLTFDTDFYLRRNFGWFRNEKFGENVAIIYSRRPGVMAIEDLEIKEMTYIEGSFLKNLYDKSKSALTQYEIINENLTIPKVGSEPEKKDDKPKEVKVNILKIGYAKVDNEDEEISLVPSFNIYKTEEVDQKSKTKVEKLKGYKDKWKKSTKQWTNLPLGKGNLNFKSMEKFEAKMPTSIEGGAFYAYLIPKSRQFKEQWIVYELDKNASKNSLIIYADNRFANDWNHNEFLLSSPFNSQDKSLPASTKKNLGTIIEKREEVLFTRNGNSVVVLNELCGDHPIKLSYEANPPQIAGGTLKAMEDIFKKRKESLKTTIKSIQETLCRLNGHFSEEYAKLLTKATFDKEKDHQKLILLTGGIKVKPVAADIEWTLKQAAGEKPQLFIGKSNADPVMKSSFEAISMPTEKNTKTFLFISENVQNNVYMQFITAKLFNSNQQIISFNALQKFFLSPYPLEDSSIPLDGLEKSSPFSVDLSNSEFKDYSWRQKLNGILFLHQTSAPPDGSKLKGKKFLSDFDNFFKEIVKLGKGTQIIVPVFIDSKHTFSTTQLVEENAKEKNEKGERTRIEILQLRFLEGSDDTFLRAPYGSIAYVEVQFLDCSKEGNLIPLENIETITNLGYVPFFPKPDSGYNPPLSYFYTLHLHSGKCMKSRLFLQFNYFLNFEYDKVCAENIPDDFDPSILENQNQIKKQKHKIVQVHEHTGHN